MQEIDNSCFWSKKHNTNFHQTKTDKYEYRKITVTQQQQSNSVLFCGACACIISPVGGSCYDFSPKKSCCEFIASCGIYLESVYKTLFKMSRCWDFCSMQV